MLPKAKKILYTLLMKSGKDNGITLSSITGILPLLTILVALVIGWSNISSQNATNYERITNLNSDVKDLKDQQKTMNDQLIKIATIIETAQKNGQLTLNNENGKTLAFAKTLSITPSPTPCPIINSNGEKVGEISSDFPYQCPTPYFQKNSLILNTESQKMDGSATIIPQPTANPTPTPQPTPTPPVGILTNVTSLLFRGQ